MPQLPITGPAYDADVPANSRQKLINWYLEQDELGGKYPWILRPTPGMKAPKDASVFSATDPVRGIIEHRDVGYLVENNTWWGKNGVTGGWSQGATGATGTITTSTGRIILAGGTDQIMLVDGVNGYIYTVSTNTIVKITDSDFPANPEYVTYQDGFFIVSIKDSEKFYVSNSVDGTGWEALDFASGNTQPDYVKAVISDHQQLWIFGTKTTEVWYNAGGVDFPFLRLPQVQLTKGIAAKNSLARSDNSLYWLSRDESGQILPVRADGYTPKAISTPAIAHQISKMTTVSDAIGYTHSVGQHEFYVLTFPTEKKTFVYDALTQQWHERTSIVGEVETHHRGGFHMYLDGESLVGDLFSGTLFVYDVDTFTEDGERMIRTRRTAPISLDNKLMSMYNLVVDFEPGVGLETGQGSSPEIMLRVARDGHNFGNQMFRSLGTLGQQNLRAKWDFLGIGRNWVLEFKVSDPVNCVILGGTADLEVGNV